MICCQISGKRVLNFFEFRKKIREKKPGKLYTPFGKKVFGIFSFQKKSNSGFSIGEIVVFSNSGNSHSENTNPESVPTPLGTN